MIISNIKSALRVLLIGMALIIASWGIAILWSSNGEWWLHHQTEWTRNLFYFVVRPLLSSDVAEAEDQMAFWIFWIPSFVVLALVTAFAIIASNVKRKNSK